MTNTDIQVIIPNLNRRFSGITSAIAAVVPHQQKSLNFASVGHKLPFSIQHLSWRQLLRLTKHNLPNGSPRVFHARRNIEMLAGLILKKILRRKLHLLFTSVAQRHHTRFTRFLYNRMDTVISTSPRSASFLKCPVAAIIPHGVDTTTYHPAPDRDKLWAETKLPGKHAIGIFGRVRPQKGLQEFVDALCQILPDHPDFTAVIIGETTPKFAPFVAQLKNKIKTAGLENRFQWLGKLPFSEIPAWFRRMTLVTAISHNEGFGLTCLEAMSSGVPVIGTTTGAFDLVIRNNTDGLVIPVKDTPALAAALTQLLSNPAQLQQMSLNARQRILTTFQIQQEATALTQLYFRLLDIPAPSIPSIGN